MFFSDRCAVRVLPVATVLGFIFVGSRGRYVRDNARSCYFVAATFFIECLHLYYEKDPFQMSSSAGAGMGTAWLCHCLKFKSEITSLPQIKKCRMHSPCPTTGKLIPPDLDTAAFETMVSQLSEWATTTCS